MNTFPHHPVNVGVTTIAVAAGAVGAGLTMSMKDRVTVDTVFWAVMVKRYVPALPGAGVPASVAVPLPLSVKVTPGGSGPSEIEGVGDPDAVTVKFPG